MNKYLKISKVISLAIILIAVLVSVLLVINISQTNFNNLFSSITPFISFLGTDITKITESIQLGLNKAQFIINGIYIVYVFSYMLVIFLIAFISINFTRKMMKIQITSLERVMGLIMVNAVGIIYLINSFNGIIMKHFFVITVTSIFIILLFVIQIVLGILITKKWFEENQNTDAFKYQQIFNFFLKITFTLLIIVFMIKIAFIFILNLIVDQYIYSIKVSEIISTQVINNFDFNQSVSALIPPGINEILNQYGIVLDKNLVDYGINAASVGSILNSYILSPLDGFIQSSLDKLANNIIFNNFNNLLMMFIIPTIGMIIFKIKEVALMTKNYLLTFFSLALILILYFNFDPANYITLLIGLLSITLIAGIIVIIVNIIKDKYNPEPINTIAINEKVR